MLGLSQHLTSPAPMAGDGNFPLMAMVAPNLSSGVAREHPPQANSCGGGEKTVEGGRGGELSKLRNCPSNSKRNSFVKGLFLLISYLQIMQLFPQHVSFEVSRNLVG